MTETTASQSRLSRFFVTQPDNFDLDNKYTEAALERHKREGLELAVRARWIAMALTGLLLIYLNPQWEVLWYHFILLLICANGWLIQRAGRVGQSRTELLLIFVDLLIMTLGMIVPNPFSDDVRPLAMQYRFDNFQYFFIILAAGTLAYSWRTVIAIGSWTAMMWTAGWVIAWWVATPIPGISERVAEALSGYPDVAEFMDPNSFMPTLRIQQVIVFVMVAVTLGVSMRRLNRLLMSNAGLERERANLSRYFSPNVVDELSQNDEPLKQVRKEDIAVLFIDIVGFTKFSAGRDPYEVIEVLRGFHARMETEVFRHHGTLDKYLGDGLMATFGTPVPGELDASNALACARSMVEMIDRWNLERKRAGEPEIQIGVGVHYGSVVLGDIGANRLEFAVIGDAVNVAAKLEALTRDFQARIIVSDALRSQALSETPNAQDMMTGFAQYSDQPVRGVTAPMDVWVL
ncbi:adenylate/guanylate cyclase domain-containing protein [Ruegeria sp. SCSIO 43209]|uniref:adenylate/guanylate cyclase domain-containing protein n=1 Tax=Ruegeria sp. SCSIO 43209 TaxID=2793010 RepID=UPI00147DDB4E|nr:adenylate/guanylate cyclase domain-containing protein [Ruegeria sp. SCSIO 43209]UAB88449.1 adenylate/guanylate cyclase domain-containing protein [Ruegeria sp. SCSIO 43209]